MANLTFNHRETPIAANYRSEGLNVLNTSFKTHTLERHVMSGLVGTALKPGKNSWNNLPSDFRRSFSRSNALHKDCDRLLSETRYSGTSNSYRICQEPSSSWSHGGELIEPLRAWSRLLWSAWASYVTLPRLRRYSTSSYPGCVHSLLDLKIR